MFALPGMKVGWIGVTGDEHLVSKSVGALELISDTFLPVNEIAQHAVPEIFSKGGTFLQNYKNWIQQCRSTAVNCLADVTLFRLKAVSMSPSACRSKRKAPQCDCCATNAFSFILATSTTSSRTTS
jgi:aspartate/methionine/tyrosine aminotransferase